MENKIKIDFNYYKTFYYVAKYGNFSLAAKELGVSQPAVSYSIAELEKALNLQLFIRKGKKNELTKSGEDLFDYIDDCFNTLILAENRMFNNDQSANYKIKIGIQSHVLTAMQNLHKLLSSNSGYDFVFYDDSAENLVKKIKQKEFEIAIVSGNVDLKEVNSIKLFDLHMAFVAPKNYVNEELTTSQLCNLKYALPLSTTKARKNLDKLLLQKGITLKSVFEFNSNQMCLTLLEHLPCIFYLPEETVNEKIKTGIVTKIDLGLKLPQIPVYVIYNDKYISDKAKQIINKITQK